MGNGGEVRLSYHGLPKGYAQVLFSPDTFHVSPMIVDTFNRNQSGLQFMAGPLPQACEAPPNATYSGLLECPCSTRLKKQWGMTYTLLNNGACKENVVNSSECFAAGRSLVPGGAYVDEIESNSSYASACSIKRAADGSTSIVWNTARGEECSESKGSSVVAFAESLVQLTVTLEDHGANISISGPADKWFGVGLGAQSMCIKPEGDTCPSGGPYAIIVSGEHVEERKLESHGPGKVLQPSATVISNIVVNQTRTVMMTRPLVGITAEHYSFDINSQTLLFINAVGCGLPFMQHCGHKAATLAFLPLDKPTCVCRQGIRGTIGGNAFGSHCDNAPSSDLLTTHNPTCYVQTYQGGLQCCRDGQLLLDENQPQPWPGQQQTYQMKFRFYFQDHVPDAMQNTIWLVHIAQAEYDIVKCPDDTPRHECVQVNEARFKVSDMMHDCSSKSSFQCTGVGSSDPKRTAGVEFIRINPHCHAPTCLAMELYNADTGELICGVQPIKGTGSEVFNEKDYVNIPACIWGHEPGLRKPTMLTLETNLLAIKRCNNTFGHTGEMGHWQMRGVVVPRAPRGQSLAGDVLV
eukprot:TRINITY_DN18651_c0_g1_i1.p1 TRINITY_DN18651_c0_g1~~TRINITY_DN18651_c0_g1_i1.p1  ORF type:complete len:647 (-),score=33.36 TRINITY_DN18651_c0_g1_i1:127-1860(-)